MADVDGSNGLDTEIIERRRFLRNAAVAASMAPVILSMAASSAGAQVAGCSQTPKPQGCQCSVDTDCAPPYGCNPVTHTCGPCLASGQPANNANQCCSGQLNRAGKCK